MFVGLLAWALTQPAVVGVALIMMVGVGMAFPYFVLSAFPEVARKFPRGGAWGEVVKQFMGFLLLATAVYFASPLIRAAASQETVWWIIFATIAAGALFLLVRGMMASKTIVGRVAAAAVAILILAPSVYGVRLLTAKPFEWQPFTPAALEQARASGKTVLVEFTATWCGNCHFLEATVLKSPTIVQAVREHEVVMLKADVTDDDAPGRPLLTQLSPAGAIPLTAVYPPGATTPVQLTGIYERSELKQVLEDAAREHVAAAQ
jgi:thiol:disulfide interchange protein DsbD